VFLRRKDFVLFEYLRFSRKRMMLIAGSGLAMVLILAWIPLEDVWRTIRAVPFHVWAVSLLLYMAGNVVLAFKWRMMIGGSTLGNSQALVAHFAGLAANLFLIGMAGADAIRMGVALKCCSDKALVVAGSVTDRMIDVFALFVLSCGGALMIMDETRSFSSTVLKAGGVFSLLLIGVGVATVILFRTTLHGRAQAFMKEFIIAIGLLGKRPFFILFCFCISLVVQSFFVYVNVMLARASGVHLPIAAWFFAWPLAKLLAAIPVSLAGLGVRQAGLAALLAPLGVLPSRVVAVGFLWQSIISANALVVAAMFLLASLWVRFISECPFSSSQ